MALTSQHPAQLLFQAIEPALDRPDGHAQLGRDLRGGLQVIILSVKQRPVPGREAAQCGMDGGAALRLQDRFLGGGVRRRCALRDRLRAGAVLRAAVIVSRRVSGDRRQPRGPAPARRVKLRDPAVFLFHYTRPDRKTHAYFSASVRG